jgi:hypothetical protein
VVPIADRFRKVAREEVLVEVNGVTLRMTRFEAVLRQIHMLALNKCGAARLLDKLREKFPGKAAPGEKFLSILSDNDMKL